METGCTKPNELEHIPGLIVANPVYGSLTCLQVRTPGTPTGESPAELDTSDEVESPAEYNNIGGNRPHPSTPSRLDSFPGVGSETYDSLEKSYRTRSQSEGTQAYQDPNVASRIEPAVSQDNPQYAELRPQETVRRQNMV